MKKTVPAIAEDEHQFRTMADCMPQLAWMANPDGYIFWYNQRWYEYTGTTPAQMEGWGWQSVHMPATLPHVLEQWRTSILTGKPFDMEFPLRRRDGSFRWFLTRIIPIRDSEGRIVRWFGTNTDVDELRRTQEALRESERKLRISEERLRLTQRAAKIGSWELNLETEEYTWSPEIFELTGRPDDGSVPTHAFLLSMMYFSTDREDAVRALKNVTAGSKKYDTSFRIVRPDKEIRWIAAKGRPFYNEGNTLLVGVFIDITEARKHIAKAEINDKPGLRRKRSHLYPDERKQGGRAAS
ncbi:MAG: PAS domain-containing protein [Terriglobales bacterium]